MPVSVKALFLVAAPVKDDVYEGVEAGGGFGFDPQNLPHIEEQAEKIIIYHSKDDPVVPFSHGEEYKKALPKAEFVTFTDKGHFLQEEFPEIIESIKKL